MKNKSNNSRKFRWLLKSALSNRSLSIDDLGRTHGMTGPSLCIAFYRPFPKAERIITDVLNLEPWDLWPERYSDGKPNRRNRWYDRGRRKSNTKYDKAKEKIKVVDDGTN